MKCVYASCSDYGTFEELIVLNSNQVIADGIEDEENGTYICEYVDDLGVEDSFYYLEKVIV